MLTRRKALACLAAGAGAGLATRALPRVLGRRQSPGPIDPPRYWLRIIPAGGVDAIYTTDPRTRKEVRAGVDVPYEAKEIVEAGGLRLGPSFQPLVPFAGRIAFVNGILVNTANHYTGLEQAVRLRLRTTLESTSALDVIGSRRDRQALASLAIGTNLWVEHTPQYFGAPCWGCFGKTTLLEQADALTVDELSLLADVAAEEAASMARRGPLSQGDAAARAGIEEAGAFFRRATEAPRHAYEPGSWLPGGPDPDLAHSLARALWAFEHDLAATVTITTVFTWDTHYRNGNQAMMNAVLAECLAEMFRRLDRTTNRFGSLADQTAIIVGSEIGRFPYLNKGQGKDHLPQIPMLFAGKWFNGGKAFGATDDQMCAKAISLVSGREDGAGERRRIDLDDVGTTLLALQGIDPATHGFAGRRLDFLLRS